MYPNKIPIKYGLVLKSELVYNVIICLLLFGLAITAPINPLLDEITPTYVVAPIIVIAIPISPMYGA